VAAAVLGLDYNIVMKEYSFSERFIALAEREIDLLMFGDTHTMERDFYEVRNELIVTIRDLLNDTSLILSSNVANSRVRKLDFSSLSPSSTMAWGSQAYQNTSNVQMTSIGVATVRV
jgi:hypothetical protein